MHIREKRFFVLLSPALHLPQMETPWEWGWGALGAAGGWIQTGKRQEWLGVIQAGGELAALWKGADLSPDTLLFAATQVVSCCQFYRPGKAYGGQK